MSTRGFVGFIPNTKIYGWFNHYDSYPRSLGQKVLKKFCSLTQKQLRHFFLQVVRLGNQSDIEGHNIFLLDWTRRGERANIKNSSEFIKDGLFCEYSYVFDLSGPQKSLMLFKGFGKEPTPGYENLFIKYTHAGPFYNRFVGRIPESMEPENAFVLMSLLLATENSYKIHLVADRDVPLIPTMMHDLMEPDERVEYQNVISAYMELRLKGIIKQGV